MVSLRDNQQFWQNWGRQPRQASVITTTASFRWRFIRWHDDITASLRAKALHSMMMTTTTTIVLLPHYTPGRCVRQRGKEYYCHYATLRSTERKPHIKRPSAEDIVVCLLVGTRILSCVASSGGKFIHVHPTSILLPTCHQRWHYWLLPPEVVFIVYKRLSDRRWIVWW